MISTRPAWRTGLPAIRTRRLAGVGQHVNLRKQQRSGCICFAFTGEKSNARSTDRIEVYQILPSPKPSP